MFENKPKFGPETFAKGETIIQQGDEPDKFYIITHGRVAVYEQPPDGLDTQLAELGPGDYFGEVGMVRRSLRVATVKAITDVEVMTMDYQTFRNWIDNAPEIAEEINAVIERRLEEVGHKPHPLPELTALPESVSNQERAVAETAVENAAIYAKGECIIKQGDIPDKFYIILEGFVSVGVVDVTGELQIIDYLTSGDYFGEMGLLDGVLRGATICALTDVKVVSFDRETFLNWMQKSPHSQQDLQEEAGRRRRNQDNTGMLHLPDEAADDSAS